MNLHDGMKLVADEISAQVYSFAKKSSVNPFQVEDFYQDAMLKVLTVIRKKWGTGCFSEDSTNEMIRYSVIVAVNAIRLSQRKLIRVARKECPIINSNEVQAPRKIKMNQDFLTRLLSTALSSRARRYLEQATHGFDDVCREHDKEVEDRTKSRATGVRRTIHRNPMPHHVALACNMSPATESRARKEIASVVSSMVNEQGFNIWEEQK